MSEPNKDYSASILVRLLNHSRQYKEDYQSLLIRYAAERFLYRLGRSDYRDSYVLKGAYLLAITLDDQLYRTTKDIDFLKTGDTDRDYIQESLKHICSIKYRRFSFSRENDPLFWSVKYFLYRKLKTIFHT